MSTLRALPAYSLDTLWSTVGVVFVYCLRTVCGPFCCCASKVLEALEATGGVANPCLWKPRVPQHTQVRHSLGQGGARAADLTRQPGTEGGAGRGGGASKDRLAPSLGQGGSSDSAPFTAEANHMGMPLICQGRGSLGRRCLGVPVKKASVRSCGFPKVGPLRCKARPVGPCHPCFHGHCWDVPSRGTGIRGGGGGLPPRRLHAWGEKS